MPKSERIEISAVHDEDILKLFESLGLLKKFNEGVIRCKFCGDVITLDNFQCIYPKDDEIAFCCSKIECYEQGMKDLKES